MLSHLSDVSALYVYRQNYHYFAAPHLITWRRRRIATWNVRITSARGRDVKISVVLHGWGGGGVEDIFSQEPFLFLSNS